MEEIELAASQKFILIDEVIKKYKLKNKVGYLCNLASVSRSGYYNYFSLESQKKMEQREIQDEEVRDIILKAYHFKRRKKGARQIKMTLESQYIIIYNLKRIRRIMKKYNVFVQLEKQTLIEE